MILNLQNEPEVNKAKDKLSYFIEKGSTIDLVEKKNTRTTKQNSALHLLFTIVSNQLNEMGQEFNYLGLKGQVISTRHTPNIIKEYVWRPIQIALFDIESTTNINTQHINEIMDVLIKYFGEKGIVLQFPSKEQIKNLIE